MNESTAPRSEVWRNRLKRLRHLARSAVPFISGVLAVLAALFIHSALTPAPHVLTQQDVNNTVANAMASATPPPAFSANVYDLIRPSLVIVDTNPPTNNNVAMSNPGAQMVIDRGGVAANQLKLAAGDTDVAGGVIINDQGDILTSLHVVANAGTIQLTFADGSQSLAHVTSTQAENDIAVISADTPPSVIAPATLGNPNAMRVGDEAYVVGNPYRLYNSMSAGVISGFERSFTVSATGQTLQHMIQFDAAVNPGNSGGPLLNRDAQVVGVVAGFLNPTDQSVFIGIGFAVTITSAAGGAGLPPQ